MFATGHTIAAERHLAPVQEFVANSCLVLRIQRNENLAMFLYRIFFVINHNNHFYNHELIQKAKAHAHFIYHLNNTSDCRLF